MDDQRQPWPGLLAAVNGIVSSGAWAVMSDAAKAVWLVLAKRANAKGRCWPGVKGIARDAGVSVMKARRGRAELVRWGLLSIESGSGGHAKRTARYTLFFPSSLQPSGTPVVEEGYHP